MGEPDSFKRCEALLRTVADGDYTPAAAGLPSDGAVRRLASIVEWEPLFELLAMGVLFTPGADNAAKLLDIPMWRFSRRASRAAAITWSTFVRWRRCAEVAEIHAHEPLLSADAIAERVGYANGKVLMRAFHECRNETLGGKRSPVRLRSRWFIPRRRSSGRHRVSRVQRWQP